MFMESLNFVLMIKVKPYMVLLFILSYETAILCFITRLPCVHYASFKVSSNRYIVGKINNELQSITKVDCGLLCISNSACILANYNNKESLCQLVSSTGTEEISFNWDILETNSSDDKNVGPYCEQGYLCLNTEWCRDICKDNNVHHYVCISSKNIARFGIAYQSSTYSYQTRAALAIDGDFTSNSYFQTDMTEVNWLKIDLKYIYTITSIKVTNTFSNQERLIGYKLMVSDSDNLVSYTEIATLTSKWKQTYNCSKAIRYVLITKVPTQNQYLHITELEVFI
ncbi:uncharacterized protein LOC136091306 isoform X1 [Hydra vulgaris]|uniref:Uncharacterized protein LOC136091306 isoform X1 n=1 Tax=Hydra vulgaris TaxID=6087 RepID=A0ABM4DJS8_HYDVU